MNKNGFRHYLFLALVSVSLPGVAAVDIQVEGIDDGLKDNVEIYLDAIPEPDRKLNFRFQNRVRDEIKKALQALGYYHATMSYEITDRNSDTDAKVVVSVDAGPPVVLQKVIVDIQGEAETDPDFVALADKAPKEGDVLDQGRYDSLKSSIQSLAIKKGYFDGEYTMSRLEVSPDLNQAFIRLHFSSGRRYHYGPVIYHNSQINEYRLDSMLPFKEGDPYLVTELGQFNQSLSNTGWFSSALVEAGLDDLRDDRIPIAVSLEPEARNKFETGIGYSSDIGPRVRINWRKPWFNSRGHSLRTDLSISKPEQSLTSSYKIPLADVEREYYQVQLGVKNVDNRDTESTELTTSVSRHWKYDTGWQRSLSLRWLYEDFVQGSISNESSLILPGINFSRLRSRGGSLPHWGDKQSITLEVADEKALSDISLIRVQAHSAWIRSLNENHRGVLRLDGGGVFTEDFALVPPSLRFFAGGDNSIRGYGYESISPEDEKGQLTGGSYLATGSLEYQYRVTGDWWVALFADGGDAWTSKPDWQTSAGIGLRWGSPVGAVRFDLAHGFDNDKDEFRIHFSLGPEL